MTDVSIEQSESTDDVPVADHGPSDATPPYDDIDTPMIVLVGVVSAITTFICIFVLQAIYLQQEASLDAKLDSAPLTEVENVLSVQTAKLDAGYGWVDKEKGTVQMPIDHAMDVVAKEYQQDAKSN